jgi:hypothetical protein
LKNIKAPPLPANPPGLPAIIVLLSCEIATLFPKKRRSSPPDGDNKRTPADVGAVVGKLGDLLGDLLGLLVVGDLLGELLGVEVIGDDDGPLLGALLGALLGMFVIGLVDGFVVDGLLEGVQVVGCLVGLSGNSLLPWHKHKIVFGVLHPALLFENFVAVGF